MILFDACFRDWFVTKIPSRTFQLLFAFPSNGQTCLIREYVFAKVDFTKNCHVQ